MYGRVWQYEVATEEVEKDDNSGNDDKLEWADLPQDAQVGCRGAGGSHLRTNMTTLPSAFFPTSSHRYFHFHYCCSAR